MLESAAARICASLVVLLSLTYLLKHFRHTRPLNRVPCAHPTSFFNPLWILWLRYQGSEQEIAAIRAAHRRHGPIVRLGPREISIASSDVEIRHKVGAKIGKHGWHSAFSNYGHINIMSSLDAKSHAQRRRCVTQPYSKATLQNSKRLHEIMVAVLQDRLMPRLSSCPDHDGVVVNAASLCFATVMDIISGHAFGLQIAPNMTRDENKRLLYQRAFTEASAQKSMFWAQEAPMLSSLFPGTMRTRKAASFLESIVLSLCMQAEARCSDVGVENTKSTDFPGLYHSILRASLPHTLSVPSEKDRLNIASELLDHLKATSDVLSVTLTQALHELSKDQLARLELQSELRGLWDSRNRERRWLPSAKELDALPYLDAVVCETLRLRPTAPDGQPRISQSVDTDLLGVHIPADVRISTYPYILHHDEAVFEKPHTWNPQRWISPNRSQDMRLWAFGMGARACLGKDMTMLLMKKVLAFVYTFYDTRIHDDSGWQQTGQFATMGEALWLSFTKAQ